MKFCSHCGNKVALKIPEGDNRPRYVCQACGFIHYQNPNVVVGTLPIFVEASGVLKVLLCLRDIEPRLGYWTLPAGFLVNNETSLEGALRETVEESCANITNLSLYRVFNVAHTNQIHMFFRADMLNDQFSTTSESSDVRLFGLDEIPWSRLAFPTVHKALKDFIEDLKKGHFPVEMTDIDEPYWRKM